MTIFAVDDLAVPDYEGGSLLLMPSLGYDDWDLLLKDPATTEAFVAALRVAAAIEMRQEIPFLSHASAKIVEFINAQVSLAKATTGSMAVSGGGPSVGTVVAGNPTAGRTVGIFPIELTGAGQAHTGAPAKKNIWQIYGYGPAIFSEIRSLAGGASAGGFAGLPDIAFNVWLVARLFQEFHVVDFKDRSSEPTPDLSKAERVVDLGCDTKLLLTALNSIGPVRCEVLVGSEFANVKKDRLITARKGFNVFAEVPEPSGKGTRELYVTVVASRATGRFNEPLSKTIIELDRHGGTFAAEYLIRLTDEAGKTIEDWGDKGQAWISHNHMRKALRWARAKVPAGFAGSVAQS